MTTIVMKWKTPIEFLIDYELMQSIKENMQEGFKMTIKYACWKYYTFQDIKAVI